MATVYDKIMEICLKRGIVYPSAEIYGSMAGFYDYGSVGARIKNNFENYWRDYFLRKLKEPFFEIQPALIAPEPVFRASGHLTEFVDPITECSKCKLIERADHILEEHLHETFEGLTAKELNELIKKHNIKCHSCGGELKEVDVFNLMFGFNVGAYGGTKAYLRPETTQGPAVVFKREYRANREKLPLGLAVIGNVFRNEISARQGLYRMREFTQAEIQIFFDPADKDHPRFDEIKNHKLNIVFADEKKKGIQKITCADMVKKGYFKKFVYYMARVQQFYESLNIPSEKYRFFEKSAEERAFYNKYQFDVEADLASHGGFKEIAAVHYRTDHDLSRHQKESKQELAVSKEGKKILPHIIELTFGIDRSVFAFLDLNFREGGRTYFSLPKQVAPWIAGIYPLVNKDGLDKKAEEIYDSLRTDFYLIYDDGGSIGRRYARADEIGIPYGITVDHQTMKDSTVTIRDRDSTKQERVKISDLPKKLKQV